MTLLAYTVTVSHVCISAEGECVLFCINFKAFSRIVQKNNNQSVSHIRRKGETHLIGMGHVSAQKRERQKRETCAKASAAALTAASKCL